MLTNVAFVVPGDPQGKGRARAGIVRGVVRMHTPAKTVAYELRISQAAAHAMGSARPLEGPCGVEIEIVMAVPPSWSKKRQGAALEGQELPTKRPDMDNVVKAIYDGMNAVVWRDDAQACRLVVDKRYGAVPGVRVRVAVCGVVV